MYLVYAWASLFWGAHIPTFAMSLLLGTLIRPKGLDSLHEVPTRPLLSPNGPCWFW